MFIIVITITLLNRVWKGVNNFIETRNKDCLMDVDTRCMIAIGVAWGIEYQATDQW